MDGIAQSGGGIIMSDHQDSEGVYNNKNDVHTRRTDPRANNNVITKPE